MLAFLGASLPASRGFLSSHERQCGHSREPNMEPLVNMYAIRAQGVQVSRTRMLPESPDTDDNPVKTTSGKYSIQYLEPAI